MTEMTAATPTPRTSPYAVLVLGMLVAILGGMAMTQAAGFGLVVTAIGGILVQFGIIAAAVELAIKRARDD